ncbi:Fe-S cluster assembly ATPase SufC, partial [Euryarchaeota archaeon]|nr:Fe-S cluster assembly ATPase SufC [Euryarchaeota archaeon]
MADEILRIENLHVSVEGTPILKGLSLTIHRGEIHAIMGRNGAGKSTLANVVMGHPAYEITSGRIFFKGEPLENLEVFERARAGMFLSFQYPAAIPGVQVGTFLKKSVASVRENPPKGREFRKELNAAMDQLSMDKSFLSRYVNDGFSGGEKKRLEILQMLLLQPHLALLDETDSGLDIDALRIV